MSATEQLLERVKNMDEAQAEAALGLLAQLPVTQPERKSLAKPKGGVWSVLGYAKKYNHPYKTTEEWMAVLREGEKD